MICATLCKSQSAIAIKGKFSELKAVLTFVLNESSLYQKYNYANWDQHG